MRPGTAGGWLGLAGLAGLILLLELPACCAWLAGRYLPPFHRMAAALGSQLASADLWTFSVWPLMHSERKS